MVGGGEGSVNRMVTAGRQHRRSGGNLDPEPRGGGRAVAEFDQGAEREALVVGELSEDEVADIEKAEYAAEAQ